MHVFYFTRCSSGSLALAHQQCVVLKTAVWFQLQGLSMGSCGGQVCAGLDGLGELLTTHVAFEVNL